MPDIMNRRIFLRDGALMAGGAAAGATLCWLFSRDVATGLAAAEAADAPGFEQRLRDLKIELPPPAKPVAAYVPAVITGNLLYTAGHIPWAAEGKLLEGRVGGEMTLEQGAEAARLVGLSLLSTVRQALGSLDRVVRLVKVLGMVNCTPAFHRQPQVVNGFSELMIQVFGERAGKAARSAVGVASLPGNVPVEIEAVFEVRPQT
jgi:enamine deaminase RidA (YjgF/YER057c/UK114 family)